MKEKIKTAALIANGLLMGVLFTLSVSLGVSLSPFSVLYGRNRNYNCIPFKLTSRRLYNRLHA